MSNAHNHIPLSKALTDAEVDLQMFLKSISDYQVYYDIEAPLLVSDAVTVMCVVDEVNTNDQFGVHSQKLENLQGETDGLSKDAYSYYFNDIENIGADTYFPDELSIKLHLRQKVFGTMRVLHALLMDNRLVKLVLLTKNSDDANRVSASDVYIPNPSLYVDVDKLYVNREDITELSNKTTAQKLASNINGLSAKEAQSYHKLIKGLLINYFGGSLDDRALATSIEEELHKVDGVTISANTIRKILKKVINELGPEGK